MALRLFSFLHPLRVAKPQPLVSLSSARLLNCFSANARGSSLVLGRSRPRAAKAPVLNCACSPQDSNQKQNKSSNDGASELNDSEQKERKNDAAEVAPDERNSKDEKPTQEVPQHEKSKHHASKHEKSKHGASKRPDSKPDTASDDQDLQHEESKHRASRPKTMCDLTFPAQITTEHFEPSDDKRLVDAALRLVARKRGCTCAGCKGPDERGPPDE